MRACDVSRLLAFGWTLGLLLTSIACKSTKPAGGGDGKSAKSAAASASAAPQPACRRQAGTARIGRVGDAGLDDAGVPLPFAAEVGGAVATAWGFAVGALVHEEGGTHAILLVADRDLRRSRRIDLGKLHGNVDAPKVVAAGADLVVVVPDGDASGGRLRVARVAAPLGSGQVTWGVEAFQHWEAPDGFAVAAGKRGLVAYAGRAGRGGPGVIRAVDFDVTNPGAATPPRRLSPKDHDAEEPRLAARAGGYWAAWLVRSAEAGPGAGRPGTGLVDLGQRGLAVAALDASGEPLSQPVVVAPPGATVLAHELAVAPDGAALIAYRADADTLGAEGRQIELARVAPDGAVTRRHYRADGVGRGIPTFLRPGSGATPLWIAIPGVADRARLLALGPEGEPGAIARVPITASHVQPLAAHGERVLVARPHGLAVDLELLSCDPGG